MRLRPYLTCYTNGLAHPQKLILEASLGMGEGSNCIPNSCIIELPRKGPSYYFYKNPSYLFALMKLMIAHWDPSYVEIYNYRHEIDLPLPDKQLLEIIKKAFIPSYIAIRLKK